MLQQFESNSVSAAASNGTHFAAAAAATTSNPNNFNIVSSVTETLSKLTDLQQEANGACDGLCSAALLGDTAALVNATSRLTDQVRFKLASSSLLTCIFSNIIHYFKSVHRCG